MKPFHKLRATARSTYISGSPWLAGVLLLFNIGFFAGVLSVDAGKFLTDAVTIGWVGAIATASATIAAVTIAVSKDQKETEVKILEGMLHAVRVGGPAGAWLNALYDARDHFLESDAIPQQHRQAIQCVRDEIRDLHHENIVAYDPTMASSMSFLINQLSYVLSVSVITNIDPEVEQQLKSGLILALQKSVELIQICNMRATRASENLRKHVKAATGGKPK